MNADSPQEPRQETKEKLLSAAEVGYVNKQAQISASLIGLFNGLAAGFAARKVIKLSPNISLATGFFVGSLTAYAQARTKVAKGMADLDQTKQVRRMHYGSGPAKDFESTNLDLKAAQETSFEAGVGGMHEFLDEKATTRGDH